MLHLEASGGARPGAAGAAPIAPDGTGVVFVIIVLAKSRVARKLR